jgi:hypothetical protein
MPQRINKRSPLKLKNIKDIKLSNLPSAPIAAMHLLGAAFALGQKLNSKIKAFWLNIFKI